MHDAGAVSTSAFDPQPWVEDLGTLVAALTSHYANLDYAVRDRRMNLAALRTRAEARLRAATTPDQAMAALRAFLRAFGDGHLSIDWTPPPSSDVPGGVAPTRGPLCKRLGYEPREAGGVDFALAGDFTRSDDVDADLIPGASCGCPAGRSSASCASASSRRRSFLASAKTRARPSG